MTQEMEYNYKLTIAYDGSHYLGWQVQHNGQTVQETIRKTLETIVQEKITLIGAGRTDTGVHAKGQVANFHFHKLLCLKKLIHSLNGMLPLDIRIARIEIVEQDFHAQFSAIGKIYHYHLWLDPIRDPIKRFYTFHVKSSIDRELLKRGAELFLGEKDFTSFANSANEGSASKGAVRHLKRLDLVSEEGGLRLEFEGNGFLYKMVRNIVGTLLEVACRKRPLDEIPQIFDAKDRRRAGKTAPPEGLFLMEVLYKLRSSKELK